MVASLCPRCKASRSAPFHTDTYKEYRMSLVFYWHPMSSAAPIACALAELGVAHDRVRIDIRNGEQRTPEYLASIPTARCRAWWWTARRSSRAWPSTCGWATASALRVACGRPPIRSERLQALSWCAWAWRHLHGGGRPAAGSEHGRSSAASRPRGDCRRRPRGSWTCWRRGCRRRRMAGEGYSLVDLVWRRWSAMAPTWAPRSMATRR